MKRLKKLGKPEKKHKKKEASSNSTSNASSEKKSSTSAKAVPTSGDDGRLTVREECWKQIAQGKPQIEIELFRATLSAWLSMKSDSLELSILDMLMPSVIDQFNFEHFWSWCGPLPKLTQRLALLVCQPWFEGPMSLVEAERWLRYAPPGQCIVRFKKAVFGVLTILYVHPSNRLETLEVWNESSSKTFRCNNEKFASIPDVLKHYNLTSLNVPFRYHRLFFGGIGQVEAENMIMDRDVLTCLLRFSSVPDTFAISIKDDAGNLCHLRFYFRPADQRIVEEAGVKDWSSVDKMIEMAGYRMEFASSQSKWKELVLQLSDKVGPLSNLENI